MLLLQDVCICFILQQGKLLTIIHLLVRLLTINIADINSNFGRSHVAIGPFAFKGIKVILDDWGLFKSSEGFNIGNYFEFLIIAKLKLFFTF